MSSILVDLNFLGMTILFFKMIGFLLISIAIGLILIEENENDYLMLLYATISGLIVISSVSAIVRTGGNTMLLPLLIVPCYQLYRRYKIGGNTFQVIRIKPSVLYKSLIVLIVLFTYNYFASIKVNNEEITFLFDDNFYYADLIKTNWVHGIETTNNPILFSVSGHPPYHYFELWISGFASNTFNINYSSWFIFGHKTIMLFLLLLALFVMGKMMNFSKYQLSLFLFVPVLTSIPDFTSTLDLPWYLQINFRNLSIINYIGAQPVILFILIFLIFLIEKNYQLALLIFTLIGVVNPLFIGIIPISLAIMCLLSLVSKITKTSFYGYLNNYKNILLFMLLNLIFTAYIMLLCPSPQSINITELLSIKNLLITSNIFFRVAVAFCIWFSIYSLNIVWARRGTEYRYLIDFSLIFTLASFLFFAFFKDTIGGDLIQIIYIIGSVPIIVLGWLFLIKHMNQFNTRRQYLLTSFCYLFIIFSVWNTYSEFNSSFGPQYWWNKNQGNKMSWNDAKRINNLFDNNNAIGYFLDEDSYCRGVHMSDLSYLHTINENISTYRVNIVKHDLKHKTFHQILLNSKFGPYTHMNQHKTFENMKTQLNIDWIYIDNERYILPLFIKKEAKAEIRFENFTLYKI